MKKKTSKKKAAAYYTVGVRFLESTISMGYTYKVHKGRKVHLGQELVADTPRGAAIVAVVRVDKTPQDNEPGIRYVFITRKVAPL